MPSDAYLARDAADNICAAYHELGACGLEGCGSMLIQGLLRKSQVTMSDAALCRRDFTFYDWGLVLTVRPSKTIQFTERVLEIPTIQTYVRFIGPNRISSNNQRPRLMWPSASQTTRRGQFLFPIAFIKKH